jgi:hypothetical protein
MRASGWRTLSPLRLGRSFSDCALEHATKPCASSSPCWYVEPARFSCLATRAGQRPGRPGRSQQLSLAAVSDRRARRDGCVIEKLGGMCWFCIHHWGPITNTEQFDPHALFFPKCRHSRTMPSNPSPLDFHTHYHFSGLARLLFCTPQDLRRSPQFSSFTASSLAAPRPSSTLSSSSVCSCLA